jgi:hypothetical protein
VNGTFASGEVLQPFEGSGRDGDALGPTMRSGRVVNEFVGGDDGWIRDHCVQHQFRSSRRFSRANVSAVLIILGISIRSGVNDISNQPGYSSQSHDVMMAR